MLHHTARFRLVPHLAKTLTVPVPALRKPGSVWVELPRPAAGGNETSGHVRIGYARATSRPEFDKALALARELQGSHDPSGIVFTVLAALSGMEREYIRDRTLEGHESARTRGKTIGGATVVGDDMLSHALHLRAQGLSLRDIAARLVIAKGKKKGQHPSPATVLRMLRDHRTTDPAAIPD